VITPAIANLIRENKTFRINSAIQTGKKYGMKLMDDHLWELYCNNTIDKQEMLDHARDPGDLDEKAAKRAGLLAEKKKGKDELLGEEEAEEPILRR